tara:strand:- start:48 stop:554 length:507 start_codon:yes stop_codon:yes gene_type:complete
MASLANDKMQDDDSTTMVGGAAEFVSDDKSEINDQPRAPSPTPSPSPSPPPSPSGGGGSSGGAHWANNDKSEITEPVVVPPAPVVVPPTSPEPSPPPSPKITPKTLPTDAPVWQYGNETIWTLDSAGWQVQADGTHTPHTGSFTKNGDSYIWTDSLGNKWEDMFYDGE